MFSNKFLGRVLKDYLPPILGKAVFLLEALTTLVLIQMLRVDRNTENMKLQRKLNHKV